MGNDLDLTELVRDGDLDVYMSFAFVCSGSFKTFLTIREILEEELEELNNEKLVHSKISSVKLYVVKERDYDRIQNRSY